MYGKLFSSMYDGSLVDDWQALVTFQQMIILCDADGVLDMTPESIARRTGIPIEIIRAGIDTLEKPDCRSRTPDEDGRRIVRLDEHRDWGWFLVNHEKYKMLQDSDTVRAQTRDRVRAHRERKKAANKFCVDVTVGNGQKRHTDIDTDTDTEETKAKSLDNNGEPRFEYKVSVPIPKIIYLTKRMVIYAESKGLVEHKIKYEFESFTIHHKKKGSKFADWYAAWQTWVRNSVKFSGQKEIIPVNPPPKKYQDECK